MQSGGSSSPPIFLLRGGHVCVWDLFLLVILMNGNILSESSGMWRILSGLYLPNACLQLAWSGTPPILSPYTPIAGWHEVILWIVTFFPPLPSCCHKYSVGLPRWSHHPILLFPKFYLLGRIIAVGNTCQSGAKESSVISNFDKSYDWYWFYMCWGKALSELLREQLAVDFRSQTEASMIWSMYSATKMTWLGEFAVLFHQCEGWGYEMIHTPVLLQCRSERPTASGSIGKRRLQRVITWYPQ